MKTGVLALVLAFVVPLVAAGCESHTDRSENPRRVGTYHAPSLVIAWVRSEEHARELEALVAERDEASKAGDAAKVAECERKGAEAQDLAHRQLAGEASIDDILQRLRGDLPDVMKKARVERIVGEGEELEGPVERVDVTDLLVERFHPDGATRKLLAEVRRYPRGVRVH